MKQFENANVFVPPSALYPVLSPLRDAGLPNGQLPILEVDGKILPQSGAQLRYVGKIAGTHTLGIYNDHAGYDRGSTVRLQCVLNKRPPKPKVVGMGF